MRFTKTGVLCFLILAVGFLGSFIMTHRSNAKSDPPVIEDTIKDLHVNCDFGYEDLLQGLRATDDIDGDITDQIIIGELSDIENGNTCTFKCGVFDSDGQYSEITRTVTFDDYRLPRVYLSGPLIYYKSSGQNTDLRELLSASDMIDGNITHKIQLSGTDPTTADEGDYFIEVAVDNSYGDTAIYTLPIHVRKKESSLKIVLSTHLVYCSQYAVLDPEDYITETSNDTAPADTGYDLSIKSNLDTSKPGVYEIRYTLSGGDEEIPAEEFLIVIVQN